MTAFLSYSCAGGLAGRNSVRVFHSPFLPLAGQVPRQAQIRPPPRLHRPGAPPRHPGHAHEQEVHAGRGPLLLDQPTVRRRAAARVRASSKFEFYN